MAFTESFAPFFADFGVDATLNGAAVRGIFDSAYGESFSGLVAGNGPVFRLASDAGHQSGQTLVVGAVTYTVTSVEPDGTGMTTLQLEQS